LTFRQIAEVLGVPEGTVKSRMAEALSRLARLLQSIRKEDSCATPETCSPPA
ncbi:MAG: hypothetical protein JW810_03950, partial [Sedimentisphaerales bacterium]|nr:hypothetical protein [Sedimentisphaerales bacterium]